MGTSVPLWKTNATGWREAFRDACRAAEDTHLTTSSCGSFLLPYFSSLCQSFSTALTHQTPWDLHGRTESVFAPAGLRNREQPTHPTPIPRVCHGGETVKPIKKCDCHLENLESSCNGLNKVIGLYAFQWQISVTFIFRILSIVTEYYTILQSVAAWGLHTFSVFI